VHEAAPLAVATRAVTHDLPLARQADGSLAGSLDDEAATLALGVRLAACLRPGMRLYLHGDLGAGKTTLVRGLLRALGYSGRVKSPTFTLVETYTISSLYLYHFDFYRMKGSDEWRDAGFREAFAGDAVCVVEWPEKAGALPPPDLHVHIGHAGTGRSVRLSANSAAGAGCLDALAA
jgi:tRNA threonylcarbamoyladenosine biosynthesis protein TsaE